MNDQIVNVSFTVADARRLRDLLDQDRSAHLNRLADWVVASDDPTADHATCQERALDCANAAQWCITQRAKLERAIRDQTTKD